MASAAAEAAWTAKQAAWTAKVNAREEAWAAAHPALTAQRNALDAAQKAGVFSPTGSPALINALRQSYTDQAGNAQRQAGLSAQLYGGGDPSLQGYAGLQSTLGSAHDMSQGLHGALLQSILQNQARLGGMQSQSFGAEMQDLWNQRALDAQKSAANSGIWGQLGGLAGTALGGLFGGPGGAAAGSRLGSSFSGAYGSGSGSSPGWMNSGDYMGYQDYSPYQNGLNTLSKIGGGGY